MLTTLNENISWVTHTKNNKKKREGSWKIFNMGSRVSMTWEYSFCCENDVGEIPLFSRALVILS